MFIRQPFSKIVAAHVTTSLVPTTCQKIKYLTFQKSFINAKKIVLRRNNLHNAYTAYMIVWS